MTKVLPIFGLLMPMAVLAQDVETNTTSADDSQESTVDEVEEEDSNLNSALPLRQEQAGERPSSPEDIEIPYVEQDTEALLAARAEAEADLLEYAQTAKTVVIGRVLTSRLEAGFPDELVEMSVEESLRGEIGGIITIRVPRFASEDTEDGLTPSAVVEGYRLLAFLDPSGTIVGGDALFYVEAGYAFRNRSPEVFIRPRSDRDWISEIDPSDDYVVYSVDNIQSTLDENPMRRRRRITNRTCIFRRGR